MHKLFISGKFSAAHQLKGLGACEKLHGHTFKVEIELQGHLAMNESYLVNFADIKQTFKRLDHTYLNDFFEMPTAEEIAKCIYQDIIDMHTGCQINYVRVWESEECYAEYIAG